MSRNQKMKLMSIVICMMLVIGLLPVAAFAYTDDYGMIYDDYEYDQLKAFLNLPSASELGYSNGECLTSMYDANDPTSFMGVTWEPYTEGSDTVYHVTSISWSDYNLDGDLDLSDFDYLELFDANNNHIDKLNVNNDTALTTLNCSQTHLVDSDGNVENVGITLLDLSTNTALQYLDCSLNALTSLDVRNNTGLISLICTSNEISALDMSGHTVLEVLKCGNNKITALDTDAADANLQYLHCGNNEISTLGISENTGLVELLCGNNKLTGTLDLTNHASLTTLECDVNQLTTLVTAGCFNLDHLICVDNVISSLNLSDNTVLDVLYCDGNALSALDVSKNTALTTLKCADNQLTSLPVDVNTKLKRLYCSGNELDSLDVSANTALVHLDCSKNKLLHLDVTNNKKMAELNCTSNLLTTIDVSNNTVLNVLNCADNLLSALDINKNTSLMYFDCGGNRLGVLDLSKNVNLTGLDCSDNQLKTLDLSHNSLLYTFDCSNNQFKSLDISSFRLMYIDCTDNPLTDLKASIPYQWDKKLPVKLRSNGEGYVGLYFVWSDEPEDDMYFEAVPKTDETFINWTDATNTAVSTSAKYAFKFNTPYDLTANFTVPGKPAVIPVSISCTKTDATLYGAANGSITIAASGGNSGAYLYSIDGGASWGSANSFSVAAGTYTAAACDALNYSNAQAQTVMIDQPPSRGNVPAAKLPSKVNAGTAVTMIPPAAPRGYTATSVTYSSSNPGIASVDANGNVTFLAGGKVTIITKVVSQTVDKKGRVKTKTTTVKKTITVQQPVSSIALNLADTTIARTQKVKLTAAIAPGTASNKKLTWKSSNPKVAAVSGAGVVTGKAGGTAVITCTAKDGSGASASCTVAVTPIYPAGLKMSKAAMTIKTGKTAALKATIAPKNTDFKTVTWISSNPAVATVDAKGKVKAIAPGTVTITATTSNGITAVCTVTVQ